MVVFRSQKWSAAKKRLRKSWTERMYAHFFTTLQPTGLANTSLVLQQFLTDKSIPVITQPPYSPDLAPSDFWLFPALRMGLKETRFATMEDIKSNATPELRKIPKEAFRRCFQQWQDRLSKCVCVCVHKGTTLKLIR